ncbi:MAG: nucleotide-binding protein [Vicingaceae bacterium]
MFKPIEKLIDKTLCVCYTKNAPDELKSIIDKVQAFIDKKRFINNPTYEEGLDDLYNLIDELSIVSSDRDRLNQLRIQKNLANLIRIIIQENKQIFIVHGRNIAMRDAVTSLLGKLRLEYKVLENEYNNGETVIEKFLRNANECQYAIVLFSADDLGKLNSEDGILKPRVRQNVVLELGFFLSHVGRKNIVVLHETVEGLEKPSDFNGVVYEAFDQYGAWKQKLIREMRKSGIFIENRRADFI